MVPCESRNWIAYQGLIAASTEGSSLICTRPNTASVANQTTMTGPNAAATRAVPLLCTENSATRMKTVSGTT